MTTRILERNVARRTELTISVITFDLDNTLWDVEPALLRAEEAQRQWLSTHRPGAIEMFDHISGAIREAEHGVEEISQATENQAVSTEEVVSMVDDVSSVSEETTSETATVSAATEEQTAAINEVTRNIRQVAESAQSLKDLVGRFDVGTGRGSERGGDARAPRDRPRPYPLRPTPRRSHALQRRVPPQGQQGLHQSRAHWS